MARSRCIFDDEVFSNYRSSQLLVKRADIGWETQRYFALRKQVFDDEQNILPGRDQDALDFRAMHIIALSNCCGVADDVIGAVRIFPSTAVGEEGVWYGGRLCVAKDYRGHPAIARSLVNAAVNLAKSRGCQQFWANVQVRNEHFFQALSWQRLFRLAVEGQPHIRMQASLDAYPLTERVINEQ